MTTREAIFDRLMREAIDAIPNAAALHKAGLLIDLAGDLSREDGTARALQLCDELAARKLRPSQRANLEYLRANAWHNRERTRHTDRSAVWAWEQPELQNQILHLRRAATLPGFEKLSGVRRCQILTNLANQFSTIGRFVDAVESWDRALVINARFGMALGNRGHGIRSYAQSLYDPGHQRVFLSFAHAGLAAALSPRAQYHGGGYENAKTFFHSEMKQIESAIDVRRPIDLDGDDLGASKDERAYRDWCLQNPLFLNPLNDLGAHAIAAQDILMLPTYVTEIGEPPTFSGFFNQMKQEFVSARWFLYEALHSSEVHFSDHHVVLHNTLDYPSYGVAVEKLKAAFRIAYSLFDKTAFFLNDYMKLNIPENKVYFRSLWYQNADARRRVLRPEFERFENRPMRGLFWLAKDLFEPGFRDIMEPDAQALYAIRNRLEHSYLKVHEMLVPAPKTGHASLSMWTDRLAYSIQREDLGAKTLRVFKLTRAALISFISRLGCTARSGAGPPNAARA